MPKTSYQQKFPILRALQAAFGAGIFSAVLKTGFKKELVSLVHIESENAPHHLTRRFLLLDSDLTVWAPTESVSSVSIDVVPEKSTPWEVRIVLFTQF